MQPDEKPGSVATEAVVFSVDEGVNDAAVGPVKATAVRPVTAGAETAAGAAPAAAAGATDETNGQNGCENIRTTSDPALPSQNASDPDLPRRNSSDPDLPKRTSVSDTNMVRQIYQEADIIETVHRNARLGGKLRPFMKAEEQRVLDAQYPTEPSECTSESGNSVIPVKVLTSFDRRLTSIVALLTFGALIALCVWSQKGLLPEDHLGHVHMTKKRVGHVHSPIYTAPVEIALHGTQKDIFDVRLMAMAMANFNGGGRHTGTGHPATGTLTYRLLADGVEFFSKTVDFSDVEEVEHFATVDVREMGKHNAAHYTANVTAVASDGRPVAFIFQVLRMGVVARHRFPIAFVIFCLTFTSIVAEKIHRSYSAFVGASVTLGTLAAIQETPNLHSVVAMIDYGTVMLLFSMMILMQMLAMTGFFNWFAIKVVQISKQKPHRCFFLLTNICGYMSMVLDNVTCVLLTGPLTYSLAKMMNMNPRALYLSMTICATVGGTATLIGDPPNIVIGSKMKVGFEKFLIVNLPIVGIVLLPLCSLLLYFRFRDTLVRDVKTIRVPGAETDLEPEALDMEALQEANRITDMPMFLNLAVVLFGILVALILSPIHRIEPAWFAVMGMMTCAMLFDRHHLDKFLEFVEWDTLFFFALLFVLVESLSELGMIRAIGEGVVNLIMLFPEDVRMYAALTIILWVSAMGSAFLESLPFTTTIVYILLDLRDKTIPGVDISVLVWPLSIGACCGGIGSIMGSSANLVSVAVSSRYADCEEDKVHGSDFIKYGFPSLLVLMVISTVWLLLLFKWVGFEP